MRMAIPIFRSRISPIFDFSTKALIIDIEQGKETERHEIDPAGLDLQGKVKRLKDVRVITLICAGISLPLHKILAQAGLEILPGIVGSVDEVLNAYQRGDLKDRRFMMPGFCQRRRKRILFLKVCMELGCITQPLIYYLKVGGEKNAIR